MKERIVSDILAKINKIKITQYHEKNKNNKNTRLERQSRLLLAIRTTEMAHQHNRSSLKKKKIKKTII